jgi:hypothetical protein
MVHPGIRLEVLRKDAKNLRILYTVPQQKTESRTPENQLDAKTFISFNVELGVWTR